MLRFSFRYKNPERPLLEPNLWVLEHWGMWQPKRTLKTFIKNLLLSFIACYISTQYLELWNIRSNNELALRNLSYTLLSTVCLVKAVTFIVWQKNWKEIIDYVTKLEKYQRLKNDEKTDNIIDEYTKYARALTYCYFALSGCTVIAVMMAPVIGVLSSPVTREGIKNGTIPYPELMSSWVPFDKTRGAGYYALSVVQACGYMWGGGVVGSYDTTVVTIMTFFAGQLKLLKVNCARIFENKNEITRRIRDCHQHHLDIFRYCRILNSLLSPVMFLYVIVCSLMICASAVTLTQGTTTIQKVWIAEFLAALVFQLFLFCWHSNEVLYVSNDISYGVFASDWWKGDINAQRSIVLLSGQLSKSAVYKAGPFTNLDVATFIAILKGSYSYYTLLK